jgi:hypothetical protein
VTGILSLLAAVPAPVAGASAVSAAAVAVVLHRRDRRSSQRPGIRRHDGSGRVWEFAGPPQPIFAVGDEDGLAEYPDLAGPPAKPTRHRRGALRPST